MTPVRVMSFNVCRGGLGTRQVRGWANRREAVAAVILEERPDVVALQEGTPHQVRDLDLLLRQYRRAGASYAGNIDDHRNAIYYRRTRFTLESHRTIHIPGAPSAVKVHGETHRVPRSANAVRLKDREGPEVAIANTHLVPVSREERLSAATIIIDSFPHHLIVGDFNSGPGGAVHRRFLDAGWRDAAETAPVRHGPEGTFRSKSRPRLDWILVPPEWRADEYWSNFRTPGGVLPSDHLPVVAQVARSAMPTENQQALVLAPAGARAPPASPIGAGSARSLLRALKEWRRLEAAKQDLPLHFIAWNRTLEEIAHARPHDEGALRLIPRISPRWIERYARDVLLILRAHEAHETSTSGA